LLIAAGELSRYRNIKAHFRFTYINIGAHVLFISLLAGMFHFEHLFFLFIMAVAGTALYFYRQALKDHSFYFMLILTLYSYIALSYLVIRLLMLAQDIDLGAVYLILFYFIGSGVGLILFLINLNKKIKHNAGI